MAMALSACGTVVSPDAMIGDSGLADATMNDSSAMLDASRVVRTAERPDTRLLIYRLPTGGPQDRATVNLSFGRRNQVLGERWEEVTEGSCTANSFAYPRPFEQEVSRFDVTIRSDGGLLAACSWNDCRPREFAPPMRLDLPLAIDVRVGDLLMQETQCAQPALGIDLLSGVAEPLPNWHATEALRIRWTPNARVGTVALWLEDDGSSGVRRHVRCVADAAAGELTVPPSMLVGYDQSQPIGALFGARNECVAVGGGWIVRYELWTYPQALTFRPRS